MVHHNLSKNKIKEMNESVENVKKFIKDKGNPYTFEDASKQSRHLVSNPSCCICQRQDPEKFKSFQSAVYIKRDTLISATIRIHKFDLPPINHAIITKAKDSKEVKMSKKEIKEAKRLVRIGADRAGGEGCILKYDITPFSPLFERQHMMGVQRKSQLVTELEEAYLTTEHYQDIDRVPVTTCVVVDFMSFQRSSVIKASMNPGFGKLVNSQMSKMLSSYPNTLLHIVFDSYVSKSLKGSERERRAGDTLELAKLMQKPKYLLRWKNFGARLQTKSSYKVFLLRMH